MSYQVTDNVTGQPVRTGLTEDNAVWLCRGLNLNAGPGGRYGVQTETPTAEANRAHMRALLAQREPAFAAVLTAVETALAREGE
jgi:hypothetical protein